jgi:hypothetical protein
MSIAKRTFCTLFDKNYFARGLALHASLLKHCGNFDLYMLCFDDESYGMLHKLSLPHVQPLHVRDVEDERMRAVKPGRSAIEYYWMFSSALPLYILETRPGLDMVSYIDADMYFYASPEPIYREFGHASIMLSPHNYSARHEHRLTTSGRYNVGMMIFRNDDNTIEALRWWKDRVIEWCYARYEDGKFGDQLYLDDWTTRFKGVHVLQHPGVNVASWNLERFLKDISGAKNGTDSQLILYHFHGVKMYLTHAGRVAFYPVTHLHSKIYAEYCSAMNKAYATLLGVDPQWKHGLAAHPGVLRLIKQHIAKRIQA